MVYKIVVTKINIIQKGVGKNIKISYYEEGGRREGLKMYSFEDYYLPKKQQLFVYLGQEKIENMSELCFLFRLLKEFNLVVDENGHVRGCALLINELIRQFMRWKYIVAKLDSQPAYINGNINNVEFKDYHIKGSFKRLSEQGFIFKRNYLDNTLYYIFNKAGERIGHFNVRFWYQL